MLYRFLFAQVLSRLSAETAHHIAFFALRFFMAFPFMKALVLKVLDVRHDALRVRVAGMEFLNPVVLAAGFDKNAQGIDALGALGFGAVEIGTVTAQPQEGNPKPRLFRLLSDRALVNRMGFNNVGADAVARRLARARRTPLGVNIGKTKVVAEEDAIADYVKSTEKLAPHADYLVVNVSSPNTPGLRSLQAVEKLEPLLRAVRDAISRVSPQREVPLFVKIAPDLANEDVDAVADLSLALGLTGIIATNTTIAREGLRSDASAIDAVGAGGLSGLPLRARSLEVLRRLRARTGDKLVLVSVGGIDDAEEAWERIRCGASLVQIYTAFVYEGPFIAARMARALLARAKEHGYARVQDAVGKG